MDYPEAFPPQARAKVEAEKIRAGRDFDKDMERASWEAVEGHLLRYILRIFLAYATEARALKLWPVDEMQRQCESLLTRLAYWEPIEKNCTKIADAGWDGMSMGIYPGVRHRMKAMPEYQQYLGWMLSYAEEQSQATGTGLSGAATPRTQDWSEIQITFLSDHRVEIRVGDKTSTLNYGELGFQDQRNGKSQEPKPVRAWNMLCAMAQRSGALPRPSPGKERTMMQKRIEEIRKKLRDHFGIDGDPIPFNGERYQTSFKLSCGPSFDT